MLKIKNLQNFAVIQELENEIELKDLTIFMGDNSAGKSYMAMLIHSFVIMTNGYNHIDFQKSILSKFSDFKIIKTIETIISQIVENKNSNIVIVFSKEELEELKTIVNFSTNYLIKNYLVKKLFKTQNLESIEIELTLLNKFLGKLSNGLVINSNIEKHIDSMDNDTEFLKITLELNNENIFQTSFLGVDKTDIIKQSLKKILSTIIEKIIKSSLPKNSIYLPASRTGYLQTYKILSNKAVYTSYSSEIQTDNHTLSTIILHFITQLDSNAKVMKNEFAEYIEKKLIQGNVEVFDDSSNIEFKLNNGKQIDLNYLSSTISELVPLVVFLKRGFIKKGGLLVIEEPEAHLSFKNQQLMAELIALFTKSNIKVLITTHSDFLIYKINNLIMQHSIDNKEISIDFKRVNIYNFILTNGISKVSKVKVDKYGIDNDYIFDNTYSLIKEKDELVDKIDANS